MKQEDIVCRCLTRLTSLFQMLYYKITNTLYSRFKLSSSYSPGLRVAFHTSKGNFTTVFVWNLASLYFLKSYILVIPLKHILNDNIFVCSDVLTRIVDKYVHITHHYRFSIGDLNCLCGIAA